ncbi:MAG: 30S ribosomal protein S1, partial [Candidatus Angelobacter sp.]
VDKEKRRVRLGIKQMAPSSLDEYLAEHKAGDVVTGRMVATSGDEARVELGEGVFGICKLAVEKPVQPAHEETTTSEAKADLSSLSSMLKARWQGTGSSSGQTRQSGGGKQEQISAGQVRSFRITTLDPVSRKIELDLA